MARPVTLSTPSWRTGRVPTTSNSWVERTTFPEGMTSPFWGGADFVGAGVAGAGRSAMAMLGVILLRFSKRVHVQRLPLLGEPGGEGGGGEKAGTGDGPRAVAV